MFEYFFYTGNWPPRWRCGNWSDALGWVNISSEIAIWGAYMAIPIILIYFIRKRSDIPFHRVFILFALFIVSCGFTHLIEAIIFYFPVYRFLTLMLAITAVVSWATAIAIIPVVPKILSLPSLANVNEMLKHNLGIANERLEGALETLNAGVWELDLKKDSLYLSNTCRNLLKVPLDKAHLFSADLMEKIYFEDRELVEKELQSDLRATTTKSLRIRTLTEDNKIENFKVNWKILFNDQNEPTKLLGSITPL
ncbi:MAG: hypothetical protein MRY21_06685 [Simkaniaceae bacterium]|nr:hypothetical protein [Simkaniaceae bacterium]